MRYLVIFMSIQGNAKTVPQNMAISFPIQHAHKLQTNKIIFMLLMEEKKGGVKKENWFPTKVLNTYVDSHT